jgi:hypothetical protein
MPRQCRPPGRRRPARSGHGARVRLLALATGAIAAALSAALAAPAAPAAASGARAGQHHAAEPLSIAITSVNPPYATPKAKVTISGTVTNATATPASSLQIRLWSSSNRLADQNAMESYLTAPAASGVDSPTNVTLSLAPVPAHTTRRWSLVLPVKQAGMTAFGAYPLAAQLVDQFGTQVDAARTFLPFWPAPAKARKVKPVSLAWVWPLIDVPHRAACPALLDDSLAASLASGGRLSQLLAVGSSSLARSAGVTWAIDPALLNDANAMTARYRVGGTATCANAAVRPASTAAQSWLDGVRAATARQDFFVTPYADVDMAALAHRGLNTELGEALAEGRSVAQKILKQPPQRPAPPPAGTRAAAGGTGMIAWPPGGIADYTVLESLAGPPNFVGTVIMDSTMMPPQGGGSATPTAVTTTPDGVGGRMHVLLADNGIGQILSTSAGSLPGITAGPGTAGHSAAATSFAREQWFLAETAMIGAQAPRTARAVVVAPPRRWDPGPALASALLTETVNTPWLRPASLSSLVAAKQLTCRACRQAPKLLHVSQSEPKPSQLRQVQRLHGQIGLLESILVHPGPRFMSQAMAAVESSAWSGQPGGRHTARQLLRKVAAYVAAQQQQVSIVDPLRVTLGGKSGEVPVSIANHLGQAVRVGLRVASSDGRVTIGKFNSLVTVRGGEQPAIKIPVRAAEAGSTTLTLWLTTPDGSPLPGSTARVTVEATHFGTMAIVIIGIALAVFVITAAARAIRRGGGRGGGDGDGDGDDDPAAEAAEPDGTGEADLTGPDLAYSGPEADSVERERAGPSPAAKEPDEHASTPGWAERR